MMHDHSIRALEARRGTLNFQLTMKFKALRIAQRNEETDTAATLEGQMTALEQEHQDLQWSIDLLRAEQEVKRLEFEQNLTRRQAEDLYAATRRLDARRKENL